jgi:hypothetical protein
MKQPKIMGPDGITRTPEQDRKINEAFAATFKEECGKIVIDYLKSITINRISGPESTAEYLRHLEGQRSIVALISQRFEQGVRQRKDGADE